MKNLMLLVVSIFTYVGASSVAMGMNSQNFKQWNFFADLNLGITAVEEFEGNGFTFTLGATAAYFFSPNVGVFSGVEYMPRKADENNFEVELTGIDIPLGVMFRYNNGFMQGATSFFQLGLFYSMGLDLDGSPDPSGVFSAAFEEDSFFGFYLGGKTMFPINERLQLGINVATKFGMGDSIKGKVPGVEIDSNTVDLLFGLSLGF